MKYHDRESNILEFKSNIPKNEQILKTLIAFCNQHGGRLVLGVKDDGTIVGLDETIIVETMEYLEQSIYHASSPPIIPKVFSQRILDKILLIVEVSEGMSKPYYRQAEGLEKGVYIRIGKHTMRATSDMIEELKWQSQGIAYENLPLYHASTDKLNTKKIEHFLMHRRQQMKTAATKEILLLYKLLVEQHSQVYPTIAGMLLFGHEVQYYMPEAMIICSHFKGVQGREAIATVDCVGTLFEQFEQAYHFIITRLSSAYVIKGAKREETLEIPQVALREVLLNAIVHRNYHLRAPTKIAIYDDRVEIFSPGNFPTPFPNYLLGLTDARNRVICRVFREAGLIEKLGSGLIELFNSYQERQLPEPTVIDGDGYVKCILPRKDHKKIIIHKDYDRILNLFYSVKELRVSDVMPALNLPRSTASRKLSEMVEKGILKKMHDGKASRYIRQQPGDFLKDFIRFCLSDDRKSVETMLPGDLEENDRTRAKIFIAIDQPTPEEDRPKKRSKILVIGFTRELLDDNDLAFSSNQEKLKTKILSIIKEFDFVNSEPAYKLQPYKLEIITSN